MLKTLRQWFINGPKEQQHVQEFEQKMADMKKEIESLKTFTSRQHVQDLLAISNRLPGDDHPRFKNLKLRVYDIEYANAILSRLAKYKDQPEPVSNQKQ